MINGGLIMYDNGHNGLSNEIVNIEKTSVGTKYFQICLSYLKESEDEKMFVIHAKSNIISGGYLPNNLLIDLGFTRFDECNCLPNGCYFRVIHFVRRSPEQFGAIDSYRETDLIHHQFKEFVNNIDEVYELISDVKRKSNFFGKINAVEKIQQNEVDIINPIWIEKYYSEDFKKNKEQIDVLKNKNLNEILLLKLLVSDGDELVNSVKLACGLLGIEVRKTEKGATVDLIRDEEPKIAVEVTGIKGNIEKKTNKISQLLAFAQQQENGHKKYLVANVYKELEPEERNKKYAITEDALKIIQGLDAVFVDTHELFKLIRRVQSEDISKDDARKMLLDSEVEFKVV